MRVTANAEQVWYARQGAASDSIKLSVWFGTTIMISGTQLPLGSQRADDDRDIEHDSTVLQIVTSWLLIFLT